jgi:hypothetical protein
MNMGERESIYTVGGGKNPWYVKIGLDKSDAFIFLGSIYEAFRLRFEAYKYKKKMKSGS